MSRQLFATLFFLFTAHTCCTARSKIFEKYDEYFISYFGQIRADNDWGFGNSYDEARVMVNDLNVNSKSDFDFNDLVFDAKFSGAGVTVTVQAVGTTSPIRIGGKEAHELFGVPTNTIINTQMMQYEPVTFDIDGDFEGNFNNIEVEIQDNDGIWCLLTSVLGEPTSKLLTPTTVKWCREGFAISDVFPDFPIFVWGGAINWWTTYNGTPVDGESGSCGDNLKWSYNALKKTLTISGSGDMKNYSLYNPSPWYKYYNNIDDVIITSGVTSIGESAFSGLNMISMMIPNSVKSIGQWAFNNCKKLTSVELPYGLLTIDMCAFSHCSSLNSVSIPNTVTTIGYCAFQFCSSLTSAEIPNSVVNLANPYESCSGITSVTIGCTKIGLNQIYFDAQIKTLVLTKDVQETSNFLSNLYHTSSSTLEALYSLNSTPPTVGSPETYKAFENCTLYVPKGAKQAYSNDAYWGKYNSVVEIESAEGSEIEKDGIKYRITSFDECEVIRKTIDDYNVYSGNIVIPDKVSFNRQEYKVTSIGKEAFSVSKLTSVSIPNSVTLIGEEAFSYCEELTYVSIPNSVTSIGDKAFRECKKLAFITIPNSVTHIGESAFVYSGITSIDIPSSITTLSYGVFSYCSELTSVSIPNSVTSIGDWAFRGCGKLASITIPNSVTHIGEWAFAQTGITSISVPATITTLPYGVFNGCRKLISIELPNNLIRIGDKAFYNCESLYSFTIPQSVTSIGEWSFSKCDKLASIYIPNSITSIGAGAFYKSYLNIIISDIENPFEIAGTPIDEDKNEEGIFMRYTFNNATLFVPKGCVDKYKATNGWKNFIHIEENNEETGVKTQTSDNTIKEIHSLNGHKLHSPSKGINIIKMKDGTTKKVLVK